MFRNVKWPTFWTSVGPAGKHDYRLRTTFEVLPMPWSWPAEVNLHEARAFCNWRSARDGTPYKLQTEAQSVRLRGDATSATGWGWGYRVPVRAIRSLTLTLTLTLTLILIPTLT